MPGANSDAAESPGGPAVRAALDRMAGSDAFRGSPQLVSFLRYVVEAKLRGESDRIKGYTIAVEALGRGDDFDPQADPIVRVEATRLRRAISRYYANGGSGDPLRIDLPPGSYVPVFRPHMAPPQPEPVPEPAAALAPEPPDRWGLLGLPRASLRQATAGVVLVLLGAAAYGVIDYRFGLGPPDPMPVAAIGTSVARAAINPAAAVGFPVVFVGPFQSLGMKGAGEAQANMLRGKLRDALARFDEIEVVAGEPHGDHYNLSANAEYDAAGMVSLAIRLTDATTSRIAYAHTFSRAGRDGDVGRSEEAIVREVAAALAQPYGIIQAREHARDSIGEEARYRCLIEAFDYWRSYDPGQHARARDCLERATETAPGFAAGYAALAAIVLEEYRSGVNPRPGAPPLQRALQAARRAVELKPGSARAHQALSDVQFARGDYPLAVEAGERAVMLNPYDPDILADYGATLVALGDRERGPRLINEAAAALLVRPARHDFYLFLIAYLADDLPGATRYAALIESEHYPLGLLARALVAAQGGRPDRARQLLDRLAALSPAWRENCRGELRKLFPAEAIVDRLAGNLGRISQALGQ